MRILAYARVSTQEQADHGVSLEAQRIRLSAYCVAQNWPEPEFVEDAGISAKSLVRPGMDYVLTQVQKKQVDVLLVLKLDRLTRSVADLAPLLTLLERGNCRLVSLGESLDTTTAAGRLSLNILVSVSQWEREAIAERTRDALRHKRSKQLVWNHEPLGYQRQGDALVEDPHELRTLEKIQNLRRQRKSMNHIARLLNEEGVPTKNGGRWYASTIKRIVDRQER